MAFLFFKRLFHAHINTKNRIEQEKKEICLTILSLLMNH